MKMLTFSKAHNLPKLTEELMAAVPALRPVALPDGDRRAVMTVSGDGARLEIAVPDGAEEAAIAAVVAAHDPTVQPQPDPGSQLIAAVRAIDTGGIQDPAAKQAIETLKAILLTQGMPVELSLNFRTKPKA